GIVEAGGQSAGQVHGDVVAAEGEAVGMHETAVREHRHRGGTGTHVDHGGANVGLIVGQSGQRRDIGAGDNRLDVEVAALDDQHQVAAGREIGGNEMHV